MLIISNAVHLPGHKIELSTIRAQGADEQNANKISSAVHLCLGIQASPLPPPCKEHLLALNDQRISDDGVVVVKAQQYRIQERNHEDTLGRLAELTRNVTKIQKARRPTGPTRGSQKRRLDGKARRSVVKAGHGKADF